MCVSKSMTRQECLRIPLNHASSLMAGALFEFRANCKVLALVNVHPRRRVTHHLCSLGSTSCILATPMEDDDFDPNQNTHILMWSHILQKGFQGGSLVGSLAIGPALAYRAGQWPVVLSTAGSTALVGVLLSGTPTLKRVVWAQQGTFIVWQRDVLCSA